MKYIKLLALYLLFTILGSYLYIDKAIDGVAGGVSSEVTFVYGAF